MRWVAVFVALALIQTAPARAQLLERLFSSDSKGDETAATPQTKKDATDAKPAPAKPQGPKAAYAAMSDTARMAIQSDLVWTGDYNGLIDGDFGDNTISSVKAFQKRIGNRQTGILNPHEREQLADAAKKARDKIGWRIVEDAATGARIGLPSKLVPKATKTETGSRWTSAKDDVRVESFRLRGADARLATLFERERGVEGRAVEYSTLRPDFFVITGMLGEKKFYIRANSTGSEVRGISIVYDPATQSVMDAVVVAMSSAFAPFADIATRAAQRSVEYGTGLIVSPAGYVVTDAALTDGCAVIVVPRLGSAEPVTDEAASELALLRVYGARGLRAAPLDDDAAITSSVALVGIADPDAQAGGSVISTMTMQRKDDGPFEPLPRAGLTGAAVTDGSGKLIGMLRMGEPAVAASTPPPRPEPTIVPNARLRALLAAHGVAPAQAGSDDAVADLKDAIVRVICVRK